MGPQPVRGFSKKDSSSLPHAQSCQFLYRAALDMAGVNPLYASYLGRRCLKKMEQGRQHHGLSHGQVAQLCRRCGCPLTVGTGEAVTLSASTVRRLKRQRSEHRNASAGVSAEVTQQEKVKTQRKIVMRGGILRVCAVCQNTCIPNKYPTKAMAEEKMHKKEQKSANTS